MVKAVPLSLPLSADDVKGLRVGNAVLLSGMIVTGRDRVHKFLVESGPAAADIPFELAGTVLYHCGPVMEEKDGAYRVIAAGPTTSMRVEMYESSVLRSYGFRGVMGKGGMGPETLRALKECGAVYFHTIGGAAAYLADRIVRTVGVWKIDEFGPTEAMWAFEIKDFPAVITMDASGDSLHDDIEGRSREKFLALIRK